MRNLRFGALSKTMFTTFLKTSLRPIQNNARRFSNNTAVFNFTWNDAQWLQYNPVSGYHWRRWHENEEENIHCHQRRVARMCHSGIALRKVESIQLYAFEKTFFGTETQADIYEDVYETEQSHRLAYLN